VQLLTQTPVVTLVRAYTANVTTASFTARTVALKGDEPGMSTPRVRDGVFLFPVGVTPQTASSNLLLLPFGEGANGTTGTVRCTLLFRTSDGCTIPSVVVELPFTLGTLTGLSGFTGAETPDNSSVFAKTIGTAVTGALGVDYSQFGSTAGAAGVIVDTKGAYGVVVDVIIGTATKVNCVVGTVPR